MNMWLLPDSKRFSHNFLNRAPLILCRLIFSIKTSDMAVQCTLVYIPWLITIIGSFTKGQINFNFSVYILCRIACIDA